MPGLQQGVRDSGTHLDGGEVSEYKRLDPDAYFMGIAQAVALRSNCVRRKVGAIITVDKRIVSTGYNGTPSGMANCFDGGCARCNADEVVEGVGYEECLCVHAEQNAIFLAARHGTRVDGGTLYTTLSPCITCLKAALQSGVHRIVYGEAAMSIDLDMTEYNRLVDRLPKGMDWL